MADLPGAEVVAVQESALEDSAGSDALFALDHHQIAGLVASPKEVFTHRRGLAVVENMYRQPVTHLEQVAQRTTVGELIKSYLPWTLFSVGVGLLFSFSLGIGLGMLIAYRREGVIDHVLTAVGSLLHSVPKLLAGH